MSIQVLVVDDTNTSRQLMIEIMNRSGDMVVVGEGINGEQAVSLVRDIRPDVVLMDIVMPRMNGLEATRRIMESTPVPIVLVSATLDVRETDTAFQAIQSGALTVLQKPSSLDAAAINHLRNTVRAMSQVKVIHHRSPMADYTNNQSPNRVEKPINPEIVAIASSTGGPAALARILNALPSDFSLPILIVQHISPDFVESLRMWLQHVCELPVHIIEGGEYPKAGHVYIAPGDAHTNIHVDGSLHLDSELGTWRYMPSGDVLLYSVARVYPNRSIGIVLTGMGDDGADGLRAVYDAGGITIAQDQASSVVYGMPQEAARRGAAQYVLSIEDIAPKLVNIVTQGALK